VAGFCEQGNESSGSIKKAGNINDYKYPEMWSK
jgi:hypothetical protein